MLNAAEFKTEWKDCNLTYVNLMDLVWGDLHKISMQVLYNAWHAKAYSKLVHLPKREWIFGKWDFSGGGKKTSSIIW